MAFKQFELTGYPVKIYKRRNSRTLRLSVTGSGDIRVSIPAWASYSAGLNFAHSKLQWIEQQLPVKTDALRNGQAIGKSHRLYFQPYSGSRLTTRVTPTEILVRYPAVLEPSHPRVQASAKVACIRALLIQSERLLPQRLRQLAADYDYEFSSVRVKQLKSRWGSCDQHKNIVLNLYLMQLPWQLIDYVLLHELAHTRVLQHGAPFWQEMQRSLLDTKARRKAMKAYRPVLFTNEPVAMA